MYITFLSKYVIGSTYKGYEFPVEEDAKIGVIWNGFSIPGKSVQEFSVEKLFSNVKNVQVKKLEVIQHWPAGCSPYLREHIFWTLANVLLIIIYCMYSYYSVNLIL
jgi:hypothetical protein